MPNPLEVGAGYAPGVDEEVLDRVDMNDNQYEDTYGKSKTGQPLVVDATSDTIQKWAKEHGYRMNNETLDYLYNQFFTEKNNESAWQRTLQADNTKYQRMVEDMRAAGLNPFITGFGSASSTGQSSAGSVGSGSIASYKNQARQSNTTAIGNVIQALASIAGAVIMAMAVA